MSRNSTIKSLDFDERTPDKDFRTAIKALENLSAQQREQFKRDLRALMKKDFTKFIAKLESALGRQLEKIIVTPLFGNASEFTTVEAAKRFLESRPSSANTGPLVKIDVLVRFNNGDHIDASFQDPEKAQGFLDYVAK
ncbi:MAG: hypothetical protein PHE83_11145 [Opitutaceae bacterium]|nr:hypothetical protein [Opitutaceae bacterium]